MDYLFPFFHIQSVCIFEESESFIDGIYFGSGGFIPSFSLCLLIRVFNMFTFKVVADKERLTPVTLLFVFCIPYSSLVPHFLH